MRPPLTLYSFIWICPRWKTLLCLMIIVRGDSHRNEQHFNCKDLVSCYHFFLLRLVGDENCIFKWSSLISSKKNIMIDGKYRITHLLDNVELSCRWWPTDSRYSLRESTERERNGGGDPLEHWMNSWVLHILLSHGHSITIHRQWGWSWFTDNQNRLCDDWTRYWQRSHRIRGSVHRSVLLGLFSFVVVVFVGGAPIVQVMKVMLYCHTWSRVLSSPRHRPWMAEERAVLGLWFPFLSMKFYDSIWSHNLQRWNMEIWEWAPHWPTKVLLLGVASS